MRHANELAERHTRRQAYYDELTHLPNRRLLAERIGQELARSRRHGDMGALLFLDLDHFKNINDSLGHPAGDQVLKQVAERLRHRVRREDTAARLGGDEFVVLLSDLGNSEAQAGTEAGAFAAELQRILSHTPYHAHGHELHMSTSIGITLFPVGDEDGDDLLRQADTAMYSAKSGGRDTVCFYRTDMQQAVNQRLQAEKELRTAIANHQLMVFYQPMVDHHGHPFGVEALVRWHHPERGLITPDYFIPVAEESGIIFELGNWVLRTACQDLARLRRRYGAAAPTVSINLSPRQFLLPGLADTIIAIAADTAADLNYIRLEVTESGLLDNVERAVEKMERLREYGVRFSIDDFGTGYSSLAYLKQLPVDTLKVDRSFIRDVLVDKDDAVIVETILAMANHLRLHSVAEGVETPEVVEFLAARGCERFQGYLFARPIPFEELLGFIDERVPLDLQAGTALPN
ncbi:MAG: EAL domain-containing protein [Gammaproteobacteria bacterium]|nr:EAL domain-containing protein [Gammaproteobacteria bacterium]